jgi:hypothetical protein
MNIQQVLPSKQNPYNKRYTKVEGTVYWRGHLHAVMVPMYFPSDSPP